MALSTLQLLKILSSPTFIQVFPDKKYPSNLPPISKLYEEGHLLELKEANTNHKMGIYFAVNSFSTSRKRENLLQLRALYGDLDVAKETDNLSPTTIETRKATLKTALLSLSKPPSIIIDTKNGLQPLWLLDLPTPNKVNVAKYRATIEGLIVWSLEYNSLGDQVKDTTRVLRLPGFNHLKADPYPITAELYSEKKHTLSSLSKQFPVFDTDTIAKDFDKTKDFDQPDLLSTIDIKDVAIKALHQSGIKDAKFLDDGRLYAEKRVTGAFQGKTDDCQFIGSTSHNIASGNKVTFVARTLNIDNKEAYQWIKESFQLKTPTEIREEKFNKQLAGETNWENLSKMFTSYFYDPDMVTLKVILACAISFFTENNPVWLFLVAPPSSMKTEFINPLRYLPKVHPISSLSPNTLLSGWEDPKKKKKGEVVEASLLKRLGSAIFTFKDFTTILSMRKEPRLEIMGQLREVYDGSIVKEFGTGKTVAWEGKIGFIAGVTNQIDESNDIKSQLGERFVNYRINLPDEKKASLKALKNIHDGKEKKEEIGLAVRHFFNSLNVESKSLKEIVIPFEYKERIAGLCMFVSKARAGFSRDSYTQSLEYIPAPEESARLTTQLGILAKCLAIVNKRDTVGLEEYKIVLKVGLDSLSLRRLIIVNYLLQQEKTKPPSSAAVGRQVGERDDRMKNLLLDLQRIGFTVTDDGEQFYSIDSQAVLYWKLSDEMKKALATCVVKDAFTNKYNEDIIKYFFEDEE